MADNRITMVDINGVVRVLDAQYVAALEAEVERPRELVRFLTPPGDVIGKAISDALAKDQSGETA